MATLAERNRRLYEQMVKAASLKPTLTLSTLLAFVIALLIHMVTLVFVFAALAAFINAFVEVVVGNPSNGIILFVFGLFWTMIAWLFAPKLGKWPKDALLVRHAFPEIYKLADAIADCVDAPHIDLIAVLPNYNATYGRVGFQRKSVLTIGIPLWALLDDQERIALLGHELAHGVNGDQTRGFIVGGALNSIWTWYMIGMKGMQVRSVFSIVFAIIAILTYPWLYILKRLLYHDSRRAEYYADLLGATVGGSDAAIAMLTKLQFASPLRSLIQTYSQMAFTPESVFPRLRTYIQQAMTSPEVLQKAQNERAWQENVYGFTHPPLQLRIDFLKAKGLSQGQFSLAPAEAERLHQEFAPLEQDTQILLMTNGTMRS